MRRVALALALALCLAPALPASAQEARISAPGRYAGYSPRLYDEWLRTNFFVEARDGVRLAVTLYRPARNGMAVETPHPAVLAFTPYRRLYRDVQGALRGLGEPGPRGEQGMAALTRYGYVVAVADVRGKGASFGMRYAYQDDNEARDAYDLVEWLARQPWTTDRVGMFGCSYYAGTQLAAARLQPPHLRAIFPQAGPFDAYRMASKGGISGQFNTRYQSNDEDLGVVPVDEDTTGELAEAARRQHAANGQMLDMITQLPFRDDRDPATDTPYWRVVSPYSHLAAFEASGIAVYHWANWFDEVADQSLISFATLTRNPRKLIVGGGTHCENAPIDSVAEHHRFFDRWLKDVDNGIDREPPVYFHTINAPPGRDWQFSDRWPPAGTIDTDWHLGAGPSGSGVASAHDGSLARDGGAPGEVSYTVSYDVGCIVEPRFNPGVGLLRPGEENRPQPGYWPCVLDGIGATFTSARLRTPLNITGTPVLDLQLEADQDVNVFAYLSTVAADGAVQIISHGRLKASGRKVSPAPYDNLGAPWHSNLRADALPVVPGERMQMLIELSPTSIIVPAGARLRLTITGADLRQRNLDAIKVSPPPSLRIATGRAGSVLRIPTPGMR